MKILIVEDEQQLTAALVSYLKNEGYVCESVLNFEQATEKVHLYDYDIVILDIGLPDGNGLDLLKLLKKLRSQAGVLIISAKNSLDDKLAGLDLGADDYITKPFHLAELNARIKSILRRRNFEGNHEVIFQEIRVNTDKFETLVNEQLVVLTQKEQELLLYFISNKNRVLTKESIAEHLWGDHMDMADSFDFIYTHIKNLRRKIAQKGGKNYLQTVYGIGYKFTCI
ncbi:response regulator transcription factor [uncultured Microscilla sp.]|uniref:response regulator transcription factor n=1 Tax=uncultured Microscilla sp. TaxID=432653 RepID=UPI002602E1CF|nr:response regulator transcription factor [uncultured Microscilla sp.]